MSRQTWVALAGLLFTWACDDGAGSKEEADAAAPEVDAAPPEADAAPDAAPEEEDAAPPEPDAAPPEPDAAVEPPDAAPPPVGWIEVTIEPRRALYALEDALTARAVAYDPWGEPIPGAKFAWTAEPPGIAAIDPNGALQLQGEGQGFAVACLSEVCGRAAFFVDAGPPTLVVDEPARGAVLGGENSATIRVRGSAGDTGGRVTVRVNGLPVDLDEGGRFALDLEASFGLNRVEVTADDGVRRPAVRELREVLWAPSYLRVDPDGATVPGAMEIRIDQALLDADAPVMIPEGAAEVAMGEMAQIVATLLGLADASTLLGDVGGIGFEATGARLGVPVVDMYLVGDGLEMFIQLPDVEIDTAGSVDLEGEEIGLDGTLHVSLAAFAHLDIGFDGGLRTEAGDVSVAVEGLVGMFEDPAANALIGTFGGRLRTAAEQLAGDSVASLLVEGLPQIVDEGLFSLLDSLADIPIELDPNIEGFEPVTLNMALTASGLTVTRRDALTLTLDARIAQQSPVEAPHPDPGVAVPPEAALERGPGAGLAGAIKLSMMNALLHEVWRAGLLNLSPELPEDLVNVLGSVTLDGAFPPIVAQGRRGTDHLLELQIGELRMEARQMGAEAADVFVISIRSGMTVQVVEGRFQLVAAADPEITAELIAQAGPRPVLSANGLAVLLEAAIWPQLQESLANGLELGLDPVDVDPASLQEVAPRLSALTVTPLFDRPPVVEGGRMVLEGGIDARMTLAAP